jgi:hypothetical protein
LEYRTALNSAPITRGRHFGRVERLEFDEVRSAIVVFQNRRGGSDFDRAKQVGLVLASAVESDLP